jgi:hypothetical protein
MGELIFVKEDRCALVGAAQTTEEESTFVSISVRAADAARSLPQRAILEATARPLATKSSQSL